MLHPNTDHDEAYNRANWTGEAWLGIESTRAPRHDPPRDISRGSFTGRDRKAATPSRRSYR